MTNPVRNLGLLITCLLGTVAIAVEPQRAKDATVQKVMAIETVTVRATKDKPKQITIDASGMVNTGGWTNPALRLLPNKSQAAGVLLLEFVACPPPPGSITTQALVKVRASITLDKPANFVRAEVTSNSNAKTARMSE